ncbi:hypothetical protein HJG60_011187 [Phyllostomus discolor]|uniref:Uncharacterized protein n=1 Tax=Phyllostomus discolor TaxID=89673 RepID=A0A834A270_9CHIR|nr:hypothetical protein HJG60_011187 [Phyllostomus discolor]
MRRHLVQPGEHTERGFGKQEQRPEKYDAYRKELEIMPSWETRWKNRNMMMAFRNSPTPLEKPQQHKEVWPAALLQSETLLQNSFLYMFLQLSEMLLFVWAEKSKTVWLTNKSAELEIYFLITAGMLLMVGKG